MDKINLKKEKIEQKLNRLKEQEAKLKLSERKSRTRQLIELGGLITKAKLDTLQTNQLYGALLEIAEKSNQKQNLETWATKGGKAFANEKKHEGIPIAIQFLEKPSLDLRKHLRTNGFKWNSLRNLWEGITDPKIAHAIANENDGTVVEIKNYF